MTVALGSLFPAASGPIPGAAAGAPAPAAGFAPSFGEPAEVAMAPNAVRVGLPAASAGLMAAMGAATVPTGAADAAVPADMPMAALQPDKLAGTLPIEAPATPAATDPAAPAIQPQPSAATPSPAPAPGPKEAPPGPATAPIAEEAAPDRPAPEQPAADQPAQAAPSGRSPVRAPATPRPGSTTRPEPTPAGQPENSSVAPTAGDPLMRPPGSPAGEGEADAHPIAARPKVRQSPAPAEQPPAQPVPAPDAILPIASPVPLPVKPPVATTRDILAADGGRDQAAAPASLALAAPDGPLAGAIRVSAAEGAPQPAPAAADMPAAPAEGFAAQLAVRAPNGDEAQAAPQAPGGNAALPGAPAGVATRQDVPAPAGQPAQQPAALHRHEPTVAAHAGRIGHDAGVEIARRIAAGGEELTIRLAPDNLGKIEVKMSFDEHRSLRAVVAAESGIALDMLRRDSGDLHRALGDAGVRTDAQSFRFDGRSSSGDGGQSRERQQAASAAQGFYRDGPAGQPATPETVYRPLRTSARVDLLA